MKISILKEYDLNSWKSQSFDRSQPPAGYELFGKVSNAWESGKQWLVVAKMTMATGGPKNPIDLKKKELRHSYLNPQIHNAHDFYLYKNETYPWVIISRKK